MGKNKKQKNKSSQMQRIIPFATAMLFHMTQARSLQGTAASNNTQFGEIAAEHIIAESMELAEDLEGDGLPCEGLHEDLHTSPKTEHKMESRLLLDVVVGEGPSVFELLASEDQPLLVRGDALLVLDLGLHILDGV